MASNADDGNTIETDSAGPSMSPQSLISGLPGADIMKEENYPYYFQQKLMLSDLQVENTDAIIINAMEDRPKANEFRNQLMQNVRLKLKEEAIQPKVKLIDEILNSEQNNLSDVNTAFKKTSYIFLFATKHLARSNSVLHILEPLLIHDPERKSSIIPVNTKNRRTKDYDLGPMYSAVKPIEYWSTDQFFVNSVQKLFSLKLEARIKRDKELEDRRRKQELENRVHLHQPEHNSRAQLKEAPIKSNIQTSSQMQSMHSCQRSQTAVEPSLLSGIQVDGPTMPNTGHIYHHGSPRGQPMLPLSPVPGQFGISQYGHAEIPREMYSGTPFEQSSQRLCEGHQTIPTTSSLSGSSYSSSWSSKSMQSSVEAQPATSQFPSPASQYPQHTIPPQYLHMFQNPCGQNYEGAPGHPAFVSQFLQASGLSSQGHTTNVSYGHSTQHGQGVQSSEFSGQRAESKTFGHSPSSSSFWSPQVNISINIGNVGHAAIGPQATLIHKESHCKDDDDDDDDDDDVDDSDSESNSSGSDSHPDMMTGKHEERLQENASKFIRSTGRDIAMADDHHPSTPESTQQLRDAPQFRTPDETETTCVKQLPSECKGVDTHETPLKVVDKDSLGADEQSVVEIHETQVKHVDQDNVRADEQTKVKSVS